MQGFQASAGHTNSFFRSFPTHSFAFINPRRVSYAVAGAFVFVGAAATLNGGAASLSTTGGTHNAAENASAPSPAASNTTATGSSVTTNVSAANSAENNVVQLNVNGQDIPVPQNGTTQQTVTSDTGGTTTVDVSGNTATQGSAANSSYSSITLNVQSSSSVSGGNTTQ